MAYLSPIYGDHLLDTGTSPLAQMVKNLPAVQDTQVQSLGQEDPLKKGMATHSSILARRIPWISLVGYSPCSGKDSDTTEQLTFTFCLILGFR